MSVARKAAVIVIRVARFVVVGLDQIFDVRGKGTQQHYCIDRLYK